MSSRTILDTLAAEISSNTKVISSALSETEHPEDLHGSLESAREAIFRSCQELMQLIIQPNEYLEQHQVHYQHFSCLRWLLNFQILTHIPLNGIISYSTVATSANVPLGRLQSVARMAITDGILSEPTPGYLAHSRLSSQFVENSAFIDWAKFITEYGAPTAASLAEATAKWGDTSAKNETAFNIAFNTDLPFFGYLSQSEGMENIFASYMRSLQKSSGLSYQHLLAGFDWASLGHAQIVDVGGSTGHACVALANRYSDLHFTVQDLPGVIDGATMTMEKPKDSISSRITYQAHDFLTPQPITNADVYFLRKIIHDWSFQDAKTILQHLAVALKPGAVIVIMDTVLPPTGSIPMGEEAKLRVRDLTMAQNFNSKERELNDWIELFGSTMPKLCLKILQQPRGSDMAVMTVQKADETSTI